MCAVGRGSVRDRVARVKSSNRSRSTTVRPTRRARRSRRATPSTRATTIASISSGGGAPRPSAHCDPIERRRRRRTTGRGSRLCASAWSCRPDARPSIQTSAASGMPATWPTVVIPRRRSFSAVDRPDAPEPLDRQRVEELELAVGGDDEQAVRLRDAARHLCEELRARDPDRDRQPDLLEDGAAEADGDLAGRSRRCARARGRRGTPRRSRCPRRRGGVVEDAEDGLARVDVGAESGRDDDRVGAEPPGAPLAHGGADAAAPSPRSSRRARCRRRRSPACPRRRGSSRCSTDA